MTTTNFFILFPRKVIIEVCDNIPTKLAWKCFVNVDRVKNSFSDYKGFSLCLKEYKLSNI